MPKFIVETLSTFTQCYVIEAENELEAKIIASDSDSNGQKWLGEQTFDIQEYNESRIEQWKKIDPHFFDGSIKKDENGYVTYVRPDGSILGKGNAQTSAN